MKRTHPQLVRAVAIITLVALALLLGSFRANAQEVTSDESSAIEAATLPSCSLVLPGGRVQRSSPVAADLDGDGRKELIVAASDGMVYAVHFNANCNGSSGSSILWQRQVANYINTVPGITPTVQQIESSPSVADIDGDGFQEIVLTTGWTPEYHLNGAMLVLDHNGNLQPGWPRFAQDINGAGDPPWLPDGHPDGFFSSPALGDVDGDGQMEIVTGGFDKCIYVWEANGQPTPGWWNFGTNQPSRCTDDTIWASPALGDITGDGVLDIVIGTDHDPNYTGGSVWALTGSNQLLWIAPTAQIVQSSPVIADINADGQPEIVVGTGTYYPHTGGYQVYAFNRFGQPLPGWPVATAGNMPSSPAVADLDNDGKLETIIGCGTEPDVGNPNACGGNQLYVIRHNGQMMAGFPRAVTAAIPWTPTAKGAVALPPVVADIDGNGKQDILAVVAGAWGVTAIPYNQPANETLYATSSPGGPLQTSPVLTNLTSSEAMVMVTTAGTGDGRNGTVNLWKLANVKADDQPWPMYRRDSRRTGATVAPPRLAVGPSEVTLLHEAGGPRTRQITLSLRNEGGGTIQWRTSFSNSSVGVNFAPASGTVTSQPTSVTITIPTDKPRGTYNLGSIEVTGTSNGQVVAGSPVTIPVTLVVVSEVSQLYVPLVSR